jgi:hypothetical protein
MRPLEGVFNVANMEHSFHTDMKRAECCRAAVEDGHVLDRQAIDAATGHRNPIGDGHSDGEKRAGAGGDVAHPDVEGTRRWETHITRPRRCGA